MRKSWLLGVFIRATLHDAFVPGNTQRARYATPRHTALASKLDELVRKLPPMEMPDKIRENLLKIRKGATSGIAPKGLFEILQMFGWNVDKGTFLSSLDFNQDVRDTLLEALGLARRADLDVLRANKDDDAITVSGGLNDEFDYDQVVMIRDRLAQFPEPTDRPKDGQLYVADVSPVETKTVGKQSVHDFSLRLWLGAKGYRVTDPEGRVFEVVKEPRYKNIQLGDFWRWLNQHPTFNADVLAALEMEQHVPGATRTREGTGTCPVCLRNIKIADQGGEFPVMVMHGYQRPGFGYIVGRCHGVGFPPYEYADEGCRSWLEMLQGWHQRELDSIAKYESGEITKITDSSNPKNVIVYQVGDPAWKLVLGERLRHHQYMAQKLERDIAEVEKLIERWEPREPPLEKIELLNILK